MKTYNNWPEFIDAILKDFGIEIHSINSRFGINNDIDRIRRNELKPRLRTIRVIERELDIKIHDEIPLSLWYEKLPVKPAYAISTYPPNFCIGMPVWYIGGLFNCPLLIPGYIKEIKGIGFFLVYTEMNIELVKCHTELFTDYKTGAQECIRRTEKIIARQQEYISELKGKIITGVSA